MKKEFITPYIDIYNINNNDIIVTSDRMFNGYNADIEDEWSNLFGGK